MADMDGSHKIELCRQFGQIVRMGVHVVAAPWLV
jgi:hypothetical protein